MGEDVSVFPLMLCHAYITCPSRVAVDGLGPLGMHLAVVVVDSSLQRVLAGWDVNIATPLRWIMEIPRVQRAGCSGGGGRVQRGRYTTQNGP
jgi:hypothetical protein